jgi:hypothetical protein
MRVDLLYEVVMSIEFWISFMISNLINELKNQKTMNILKTIIVGVGAVMWSLKTNMTHRIDYSLLTYQDNSKGVRIPLSTPFCS